MNEIIKLTLKLFIITAVASLALAFTNSVTSDIIEERIALDNQNAREKVMSPSDSFEEVEAQYIIDVETELGIDDHEMVDEVYQDIVDGEVFGYTFKVLPKGYGGKMTVLVGVSDEGDITGLEIVEHAETPGLGSHITGEEFKNQFKDKSARVPLDVIKGDASGESDIEALSGATISTQAVVDGVNMAIEIFNKINE